jgi:hypothetical protein
MRLRGTVSLHALGRAIVYGHLDFATGDAGIWGMDGNGGNWHHIISPLAERGR